ncbi:MAG: ABC transporter substrate-binding protein [Rhodobacteraceae bacterium]|nr:ABC transporter substrate-binding protein [Paracoccaceae bacterium]
MAKASRLGALIASALLVAQVGPAAVASAAPGVAEDSISFSQIACFSGTCRIPGLQYRAGILAAFQERNRQGGVQGRQLKLEMQDDRYEPDLAEEIARAVASENDVFAIIGGVGTPTARRIAPILRKVSIPFVGILSGADFLRDAARYPNVVHLRPAYSVEVHALVDHLHEEYGARRFGILYQDDSFGRSVLRASKEAMASHGLRLVAKATYSSHSHAVQDGVFTFATANADAVLLATGTRAAADSIVTARLLGYEFVFAVLSVVGVDRLLGFVEDQIDPTVASRIVMHVEDTNSELVRRFRSAFSAYRQANPEEEDRTLDSIALEGYILGRFVVDVLEQLPDEPTREQFLATALSSPTPIKIDDWRISFEAGSNSGSSFVRLDTLTSEDSGRVISE